MTKITSFILFLMLTLPALLFASQPNQQPQPLTPAGASVLERIRLIQSIGIVDFVNDLNANGKLGYRLDKSIGYGGEGDRQSYAAVLALEPGKKYEYDWMSSPNKKLLEGRLNAQAQLGFNYVAAYALTACSDEMGSDSSDAITSVVLRLGKGDAFLLERKSGSKEVTRQYKVFIARVRLGDSAEKDLNKAIDAAALAGYRPVKILFARQSLLDFSVSILTELVLPAGDAPKVDYRFLKKTSGLPDETNKWAAQGFRFITGRRVGLIGMALMKKVAPDPTTYTFIDEKKYAKEFDKTVAMGNRYEGIMNGDLTCGSTEVENERLVFEREAAGKKHEYKILDLLYANAGNISDTSMVEFNKLLTENYEIKDLFYYRGVKMILEK